MSKSSSEAFATTRKTASYLIIDTSMSAQNKFDSKMADEIFAKTKNPREWLSQAEYLNAAGYAVVDGSRVAFRDAQQEKDQRKRFELISSPENWMTFAGVMLYGFAIENLLKGKWVSADPDVVSLKGGHVRVPWSGSSKVKGHDLVWLARKQGIEINGDEAKLLDFLTKVTTWGGRYPAPSKVFWGELGMEWNDARASIYFRLYERLREGILLKMMA